MMRHVQARDLYTNHCNFLLREELRIFLERQEEENYIKALIERANDKEAGSISFEDFQRQSDYFKRNSNGASI